MIYGCERRCSLLNPTEMSFCFGGCAVNLMKPELCDYLRQGHHYLICKSYVAAEMKNISICHGLLDLEAGPRISIHEKNMLVDLCFVGYAVTKNISDKDDGDCLNVQDDETRSFCSALVKTETILCEDIADSFRRDKCKIIIGDVAYKRTQPGPYHPDRMGRPYYLVFQAYNLGGEMKIW
jgi:hypothetical protein